MQSMRFRVSPDMQAGFSPDMQATGHVAPNAKPAVDDGRESESRWLNVTAKKIQRELGIDPSDRVQTIIEAVAGCRDDVAKCSFDDDGGATGTPPAVVKEGGTITCA